MWTDDHRKRSYSTITAHWITDNWELKSRIICTDEFNAALPKTGHNVKAALMDSLQQFNINTEHLKKAVFTTDKGSNIVLALTDEERLNCVNHIINRVLQQSLEEKHCPAAIYQLIRDSKSAVQYVKRSSIQNLLKKTLKQSMDVRWNSTLTMLQSISESYQDLEDVFEAHKPRELHRITSLNTELLKELVSFLQLFADATRACEGQSAPTLQEVIPWMVKLEHHCEVYIFQYI